MIFTALVAAAAGLAMAPQAAAPAASFDRQLWLDDYTAIKKQLAQYYANLDTRLLALRVDPARLDKQISARLNAARSDLQAYDALRDMVELFDDPHLKFQFSEPRPSESGLVGQGEQPSVADCASAGYKDGSGKLPPQIAALPGWRSLGEGPFPHGVAGALGIVRIPSFSETSYGAVCRAAFKPGLSDRELQLATRAVLLAELDKAIGDIKRAGASRLLIDLTGNGGGTEWDVDAAAKFTTRQLNRGKPRVVNAQCDRSGLWQGNPGCELFPDKPQTDTVQGTGKWTGPVAILADWRTASASEEFIGWLVDNGAAKLVGEKTMGAGCGYIDGAHPLTLKAAPLTLAIPNCARFNAKGDNEISGWTPDVAIPSDGWTASGLVKAIATAMP